MYVCMYVCIYIYIYIYSGVICIGKTLPGVLNTARGHRLPAALKTGAQFFPLRTDRPGLLNNIFIFFPKFNEMLSQRTQRRFRATTTKRAS